jgi:hypothetical protein
MGDFDVVSVPLVSSVELPRLSKSEALITVGLGFCGVIPLSTPRNDKGCKEHISLASTATERKRAHRSWALKSREPVRFFAFDINSSLSDMDSKSSWVFYTLLATN